MINLHSSSSAELKPHITVIGVGGAGGNAINNMIESNLDGVEFIVANTDSQSLTQSRADRRIQLGSQITKGLGAGARPEIGQAAAEETLEEIISHIHGSNMVFITAGMGGGTGTGATPVIAKAAREHEILTVGVVTKPFDFEGKHRMRIAESGIEELSQYVDTLIIIPNQNLFRIVDEQTTFANAFKMADNILYSGVRGITDLMVMPGIINLDFADIRTIISRMGKAMMGTGEAEGKNRELEATELALNNPLLDNISIKDANGVLINITGGPDITLFEVDAAVNLIRDKVDQDANIIFGTALDEKLDGKIRVSIVATGIKAVNQDQASLISVNKTEEQFTDIITSESTDFVKNTDTAQEIEPPKSFIEPEFDNLYHESSNPPLQNQDSLDLDIDSPVLQREDTNPDTNLVHANKHLQMEEEEHHNDGFFKRLFGYGKKSTTKTPDLFQQTNNTEITAVEQQPAIKSHRISKDDRISVSYTDEDLQEIPTFLRR
ncbi:MAG: cell division protein FtsZ [Rhodospirillaceae bacterium]|jgi:cell division protein FtsZ|nr:cell division protein FtsZ [Rhodospirillaceae bacterium]